VRRTNCRRTDEQQRAAGSAVHHGRSFDRAVVSQPGTIACLAVGEIVGKNQARLGLFGLFPGGSIRQFVRG
jgi:hypothetical protein